MKKQFQSETAAAVSILASLVVLLCAPGAHTEPVNLCDDNGSRLTQTFTTIDPPGSISTFVIGINSAGDMSGSFTDSNGTHGFVREGDGFTTIDMPDAVASYVEGINDTGNVVVRWKSEDGVYHAGIMQRKGGKVIASWVFPKASFTGAVSINNKQVVAGTYIIGPYVGDPPAPVNPWHGYIRYPADDGRFVAFDLEDSIATICFGINDHEDIVGRYDSIDGVFHGYLLHNGEVKTIDVPDAVRTFSDGINNNGDIVGRYNTPSRQYGYLLRKGAFTTIDVPGSSRTTSRAINQLGNQIVGEFDDADGMQHGYVLRLSCDNTEVTE